MLPLVRPTHHPHLRPASRPPPPGCSPPARAARPRLLRRRSSYALALTRAQPPRAEAGETETSTAAATSSSSSVLSFLCPLLKLFGGGDPSQKRNDIVEVATSSLSSLARLPWGSSVAASSGENVSPTTTTAPTLQLYEFGNFFWFPLLVDASTGVTMYESGDIVKYLFRQYGQGKNPSFGLLESTIFTGWVPTLLRAGRGMTMWSKAGAVPAEKLELFSFENNTYARFVREALCELELPYVLQNVGEGSSKMDYLLSIAGAKQVPYLVDPNTGFQSGDHKKILSYLFQQYSTSS